MGLRRALIIATVFALAANATPSRADAPTLGQKVDALNAAIAKASAKEKPVLQAVLHDILKYAGATEPVSVPTITKAEARNGILAAYLLGQRDSFGPNEALVNAYAAAAQSAATAADDCRKANQVVTSTSGAAGLIENTHHMHFAQGFVALLPVFFMMFHKFQDCDKPITVPTPTPPGGGSGGPKGGISSLDDLLNQLNLPKQP